MSMSVITAHRLWVRVKGADDRALLRNVTLSFSNAGHHPGLIGLVGPNGAGKSTLLRALAGVLRPDGGGVELDGVNLRRLSVRERAAKIGYIPQHAALVWDYTAAEIVALGAARAERPTPPDLGPLAPLAQRRWSQLSGGERAQCLIAAALAAHPPTLLCDEPGAALDPAARRALMARLADVAAQRLTVIVTHDLDLAARWCARLVVLAQGAVVADGPTAQVVRGRTLDDAFATRFHRVAAGRDDGPLLATPPTPA